MAIVSSFGQIKSISTTAPTWYGTNSGALGMYGATAQSYAALYKAQPNVRTVVEFLARNIAQLGLHVYRRVSDTDRQRVSGHEIANWLHRPNPSTTRYRLIESTIQDLGIYFNAYWLKVRMLTGIGLIRIPPDQMRVEGGLQPSQFVWTTADGKETFFKPSEIVHFSGYNPESTLMGLSPLETLRRTLAEEHAAGEYRENFWQNAARVDGVVTRPKEVPPYTPAQAQMWREQWQAVYAGGAASGKTVLLQQGETFTPTAFSARESEYLAARKLAREECAAAYHIPLPMVGILDHATFSNIKEQHKHLYQDCLGPWLVMVSEELERQLLPDCKDTRDIYLEFNISAKLAGSFEEQTDSLVKAVGGPFMTVNEARARQNLPATDDEVDDSVASPLNMSTGAGSPTDPAQSGPDAAVASILAATTARIDARMAKLPPADRLPSFDVARWGHELTTDLTPLLGAQQAVQHAARHLADVQRRLESEAAHV